MSLTIVVLIFLPGFFLLSLFLALELLTRAIDKTTEAIGKVVVVTVGAVGGEIRGPSGEVEQVPDTDDLVGVMAPWDAWGDSDDDLLISDPTYADLPDPPTYDPKERTVSVRPGHGPMPVDMSAEGYEG